MPGLIPSLGPTLFSPWFPSGCSGHWRGSVQAELAGGGESGPHPGPWQPQGASRLQAWQQLLGVIRSDGAAGA